MPNASLGQFLLLLATIPAFSLSLASAIADEPLRLDRDRAINVAYQNNRELAIATLAVARAEAELKWAGRLDNPELELSLSDDAIGLDEGEGVFEVAFSQRFPLTSRLKDEKRLRSHQVQIAQAEIAERRRELAGMTDLAVVDLIAVVQLLETERGLLEVNARISKFLESQVAQGVVSQLDAAQAKLAGRMLRQEIDRLEAERHLKTLELKALLGLEPDADVEIDGVFQLPGAAPNVRRSDKELFASRPDLRLAKARSREAETGVALEHSKRWEDISIGMFVESERAVDEPEGLERNTLLGVGVSIPFPLLQRNQAGIAQALLHREGTEKSVAAAQFQIRSEYERAFQHRQAQWELAHRASGEVLALADRNVEQFEKAQREGQASLLQVQRAQEQQLELRTAALSATAEYLRADAWVRSVSGDYPGLDISNPTYDHNERFSE